MTAERLRQTLAACFTPEWHALSEAIAEQMLSNVQGWELWLALQADLARERATRSKE